MQVQEKHYYTPEEYLELEIAASFRSEYYDGKILPRAGGTPNHNRISLNLSAALNFALKRQPYDVFMSDMRFWIPRQRLYTYPDVMVVAGQLEFAIGRKDTITNACMIAEVLSESTEKYDRVGKFKLYRTMASLREYILISQSEMFVEQYSKIENNKWLLSEYEESNSILALTSMDFQVSLGDIYDKVEFKHKQVEEVK
ncbi:MAG: Uma2 family endonuclease [Potamolinea sp.]